MKVGNNDCARHTPCVCIGKNAGVSQLPAEGVGDYYDCAKGTGTFRWKRDIGRHVVDSLLRADWSDVSTESAGKAVSTEWGLHLVI